MHLERGTNIWIIYVILRYQHKFAASGVSIIYLYWNLMDFPYKLSHEDICTCSVFSTYQLAVLNGQ